MKKLKYCFEQFVRIFSQALIGNKFFNIPILYQFRDFIYHILFNTGKKLHVGHNVYIDREHQKYDGSISIGDHVTIAHNVHLDYTGHLFICNNVKIADGVHILTHKRDIEALRKRGEDINIQTTLIIDENVYIGNHSIILASCHNIGKNAIIGAGSIVTKDVPENVVYCGEAAKEKKKL
jgi:maltose O-acetyltransferase